MITDVLMELRLRLRLWKADLLLFFICGRLPYHGEPPVELSTSTKCDGVSFRIAQESRSLPHQDVE